MSIKIGDTVPNATLAEYQAGSQPQMHQVEDLVKGKKIALFAVPGAFTPLVLKNTYLASWTT